MYCGLHYKVRPLLLLAVACGDAKKSSTESVTPASTPPATARLQLSFLFLDHTHVTDLQLGILSVLVFLGGFHHI
jgi:hypothetical protein